MVLSYYQFEGAIVLAGLGGMFCSVVISGILKEK
jgi:hypothetical protein